MAEKPARSKEVENELTLDQVKEQLVELGKKTWLTNFRKNCCKNWKI